MPSVGKYPIHGSYGCENYYSTADDIHLTEIRVKKTVEKTATNYSSNAELLRAKRKYPHQNMYIMYVYQYSINIF